MNYPDPIRSTEQYVDRIFGSGMGKRHVRFLEKISNAALREQILRFHAIEGDTQLVTIEENYLIGVCVLCACGHYGTAAMFTKVLRHLGTSSERILEAVGRISMWAGGLPAVEASFAIQNALREYERDPAGSLAQWFPDDV